MRENLFRGKRLDNGEWAEGGLVLPNRELPDGAGLFLEGKAFLCVDLYSIRVDDYDKKTLELAGFVEIDPETVGQYTGLCDKNGKKIFEGDIIRRANPPMLVVWNKDDASFEVKYSIGNMEMVNTLFGHHRLEVIGNIHDNPEFLKDGAE